MMHGHTPPPVLRVRFTPIQLTRRRNVIIGLPPPHYRLPSYAYTPTHPHKPTYTRAQIYIILNT